MKTLKENQKIEIPKVIPSMDLKTRNTSPTAVQGKTTQTKKLTPEAISQRAWSLWDKDGRPSGRDEHYWLKAETQLKKELGIS